MTVTVYALVIWWAVSPAIALMIGALRGHPLLGWLCGLVPLAGPFIAARLTNIKEDQ